MQVEQGKPLPAKRAGNHFARSVLSLWQDLFLPRVNTSGFRISAWISSSPWKAGPARAPCKTICKLKSIPFFLNEWPLNGCDRAGGIPLSHLVCVENISENGFSFSTRTGFSYFNKCISWAAGEKQDELEGGKERRDGEEREPESAWMGLSPPLCCPGRGTLGVHSPPHQRQEQDPGIPVWLWNCLC